MSITVAIVAPGEMGSAIGRELRAGGARVLTSLQGRSAASAARVQKEGFEAVADDDALVAQADYLLSVVPPGSAVALAERFAPALARAARKPVYADCNAVSPGTAREIGRILAPSGCPFADGALFGGPTSGKPGIVLYASGPGAAAMTRLAEFGPKVRVMEGPVGAASGMKLSFAGINKGFTALGAFMILAATRAGCTAEVRQMLADTQPALLAYMEKFVPAMFPKAYRWEPEMREIAAYLGSEDPPAGEVFTAIARLYGRLAQDLAAGGQGEIADLARFCGAAVPGTAR
ncbi:NAD(P)-dependent oxidoreductase [Pigmentiphaga soli]|uniref:NAD(P)-dependent oxidoreductase n=1 Tax=Pigmentiphaga soli TaxID=1007095 RepID=A0ABP8GV75_9BURK